MPKQNHEYVHITGGPGRRSLTACEHYDNLLVAIDVGVQGQPKFGIQLGPEAVTALRDACDLYLHEHPVPEKFYTVSGSDLQAIVGLKPYAEYAEAIERLRAMLDGVEEAA